jgi:hypothetical protein
MSLVNNVRQTNVIMVLFGGCPQGYIIQQMAGLAGHMGNVVQDIQTKGTS